jgi:phage-related protein
VAYTLDYFSPRVLETIESWPVEILADYAKLVELLLEHGPNLRMPHSRSMGEGLFELRPRGREGIGRTFYCFLVGKQISFVHAFIKKSEATPDRELKIARKRIKVLKNG